MLDVAIVGGEVVDGTGAPRRRADVGIRDGRIVAVGELDEPARRRLDADGRVVAPGFIDVHTHYDAQWAWDPHLTPSPFHGVTTALAGNCGFTLAPMEEEAAGYLAEMLSRVEGMPLPSLRAGLDIHWKSFGDFLGAVDGNVALNIGFMVGHSTVRRLVLGPDWQRPATEDEVESIRRMVADSLDSGALGFSSSLSDTHNDAAGTPVPSRFSSEEELLTICREVREHAGTWLEFIPWAAGPFPQERIQLMARMSEAARRPLNWNLLLLRPDITEETVANKLSASDVARRHGGAVYGLTLPTPQTLYLNLETGFLFDSVPLWADVLGRPRAEKLSLLADPGMRGRLADAGAASRRIWYDPAKLHFSHVASAEWADVEGMSAAAAAERRHVDPWDLIFDVVIADGLSTVLMVPPQGDDPQTWRRRLDVWRDERTIVGGSDAGAHLDMLDTFGFFTDLVGPSVRERQLLPLEEAVRMITYDAANAFGLVGRGRIAEGYAADIVVFDEGTVGPQPVETRNDLPANGMRLYAGAAGIERVLVNGDTVVELGEATDTRPGTVLRSGRDTRTVPVGPA